MTNLALTGDQIRAVLASADALPGGESIDYNRHIAGDRERYDRAVEIVRALGLVESIERFGDRDRRDTCHEVVRLVNGVEIGSPIGYTPQTSPPIERLADVRVVPARLQEDLTARAARPLTVAEGGRDSTVVPFPATRQEPGGDVA